MPVDPQLSEGEAGREGSGPGAPRPRAGGRPSGAADRWKHVLPCVADAIAILDERGTIREVTAGVPGAIDILGHDPQALIGSSAFALLDPSELDRAWLEWERVLSDRHVLRTSSFRTRHRAGHFSQVQFTAMNRVPATGTGGGPGRGIVLLARRLSPPRASEALIAAETEILRLIARGAPIEDTLGELCRIVETHTAGSAAILVLRPGTRELDVAVAGSVPASLLDMLTRAPVAPSPTSETIDVRRVAEFEDLAGPRTRSTNRAADPLAARSAWSVPVTGNRSAELLGLLAVFHRDDRPPNDHERRVAETASHLAAIAIERHRWQVRLWHEAHHDELTGLPNRAEILTRLDDALERVDDDHHAAVVFVDLDRFKAVNDNYGHAAGDKLLVRFALRLRNLAGPDDIVGRVGADEFVVVVPRAGDLADARLPANRIDLALSEPFSLDEGEVYLSASVGVALSTGTETGAELLQHADAAMARAKQLGGDRMEVFDQVMRTHADEALRIDRQLRAAIDRAELLLHFQVTVDVRTGAAAGAEALLRWAHPSGELWTPDRFLHVAEDTSTVVRIGRWVVDRAVAQARQWIERHPVLDPFVLTINVSPRQLAAPGFADGIGRVLSEYAWPADQLMFDLTEGILLGDRDASLDVLRELDALGVSLAIDDFGTGFSSLGELHRFPLDAVKIHPSFVQSLGADGTGSPVATAVLDVAHALGLIVVAEGVEHADQYEGLKLLGCEQAQGFHFGQPGPAEEIERTWLAGASR